MPDLNPDKTEEKISIDSWSIKFSAAEKMMKAEFLPKYKLARKRLRSEYEVKANGSRKMTHEQVNLVYSIGTNLVNSLYFKSPNCNLTAREEVDHMAVENTEVKINDILSDKKVKNTARRVIWDAYLGGFGGAWTDYVYDDMQSNEPLLAPQPVLDPMGQPARGPQGPILENKPIIDPVTQQPKMKRIVLKNDITITRIRPDLFRFPKGFDFDNFQDSPWIGFAVITPLEQVQQNPDFDKTVTETLKGEKYEKLSGSDEKNSSAEEDEKYVKVNYCLIKPASEMEHFKLLAFTDEDKTKPLQYIDYNKGHVGYPIKFLYFNPLDDDAVYPNGDPWIFESQSNAVDKWWKTFARHVERSAPKTIYDQSKITTKEIGNVKANNDNQFVGINNEQNVPIDNLFKELQAPKVHPDVSQFYQIARQLMGEISPKSGLTLGAQDQKTDTATEAKIIQGGEMVDTEARVDNVKDFIEDICMDIAGILENIAAPMNVKQVMENGQEITAPVGKEGFTSKIKADIDVESMQSANKDVLRRQIIDALSTFINLNPIMMQPSLGPNGMLQPGVMLNGKFWIQRIAETLHIRNIEDGFIPAPPPMMAPPPAEGGNDSTVSGERTPEATEATMAQQT